MERLTTGFKTMSMYMGSSEELKIYNRLSEYEDTGLTPEEIIILKDFRDQKKGVEEYFAVCIAKDKAITENKRLTEVLKKSVCPKYGQFPCMLCDMSYCEEALNGGGAE